MAQGRCAQVISMIEWIRISRLSIKKSLAMQGAGAAVDLPFEGARARLLPHRRAPSGYDLFSSYTLYSWRYPTLGRCPFDTVLSCVHPPGSINARQLMTAIMHLRLEGIVASKAHAPGYSRTAALLQVGEECRV
jgi:hypothetical protein